MTATSTVTDEAVEAAAVGMRPVLFAGGPPPGWLTRDERDRTRLQARAALEAAVPLLAPQPVVDREALEKALRLVLAQQGVDEFHDLQPLGWKLADAVIDLLNGTADRMKERGN